MPLWLEQFFIEHPWAVWWPLVVCVGGAGLLWWRQSRKGKSGRERKPVRVGWAGAAAVVLVIVGAIAGAGHLLGLWGDVWTFVNEQPQVVAWWVGAVGGAIMVWGVAAHAWRAEARLARQCRKCGYDMTGVAGLMKCPECGRVATSEKQLRPLNVRRAALWLGGLIIVAACLMPAGFAVRQRGVAAALPTRTLLWWVGRTSSPPNAVMRETLWRMSKEQNDWAQRAGSHADDFAARLLECPLANIDDYATLLTSLSVSDSRQVQAVLAASSTDPVRRLAALKLLNVSRQPIELTEQQISTWERDADPRVANAGKYLRYSQVSRAMARLGGAEATRMPEDELLRNLRICTSTPAAFWLWSVPGMSVHAEHQNPEIAARAVCLIGAAEFFQIEPDVSRIAAMMKAKEVLDRAAFGPGPVWASAGNLCLGGQPNAQAALRGCIRDGRVEVRETVFRQLLPSKAIPAGASWAAVIPQWMVLLPDLEAQLATEPDVNARAALQRLIAEIKGKPPAGYTP